MSKFCEHETFRDICGICHRDNVIASLRAALSTARADALEEAAVVCEECFDITIGAAIRSLKDREHSA